MAIRTWRLSVTGVEAIAVDLIGVEHHHACCCSGFREWYSAAYIITVDISTIPQSLGLFSYKL